MNIERATYCTGRAAVKVASTVVSALHAPLGLLHLFQLCAPECQHEASANYRNGRVCRPSVGFSVMFAGTPGVTVNDTWLERELDPHEICLNRVRPGATGMGTMKKQLRTRSSLLEPPPFADSCKTLIKKRITIYPSDAKPEAAKDTAEPESPCVGSSVRDGVCACVSCIVIFVGTMETQGQKHNHSCLCLVICTSSFSFSILFREPKKDGVWLSLLLNASLIMISAPTMATAYMTAIAAPMMVIV